MHAKLINRYWKILQIHLLP